MNKLNKLFLSELRIIEGENKAKAELSIDAVKKALVDQENLNALGFDLKKDDVIKLAGAYAGNSEITPLYIRVQDLEPGITVSPMYPNFPTQVLEMSEVEYRVNQILHYASTYGVERLLEVEVIKGFLPETEDLIERVEDEQVAKLKTIDYLHPDEVNSLVIEKLIGKKERLLPNELYVVKEIVKRSNRDVITEIPFKENIGAIFGETLLNGGLHERYRALNELEAIVKHPGDVLDIVEQLVVMNHYKHFKTSLKRGLVDLLEKFSKASLEENLASNRWSGTFLGKKGKKRSINRNIALIDYLSYNKFSKNLEASEVVNSLKNGELLSWNQNLEIAYKKKDLQEVLRLLNQRPGIYFRQINRLFKSGVDVQTLIGDVSKFAGDLKIQSIVSALNNYDGEKMVDSVFYQALMHNLASQEIESLVGKKVFIEQNEIDFSRSRINVTDKFQEGGYIQNGMAIKLPENAKFLRFFTYWNDERRIDIDLHASYKVKDKDFTGHIGWHGDYKTDGMVHSGDITHSDAAEYIDIDMAEAKKAGVTRIQLNLNSYTGVKFNEIDTVFAGVMLVGELREKVKLYSQKNTLFRHDLENKSMSVDYAVIDLESNTIQIVGKNSDRHNDTSIIDDVSPKLSLESYLSMLLATQKVEVVDNEEDAEVVIGFAKSDKDNYLSLTDENFFM